MTYQRVKDGKEWISISRVYGESFEMTILIFNVRLTSVFDDLQPVQARSLVLFDALCYGYRRYREIARKEFFLAYFDFLPVTI